MSGEGDPGNYAQGSKNQWGGQRPGQPMNLVQYFGPRSLCSNVVFQQPGTYTVGVQFSGGSQGYGTQGAPPAPAAPATTNHEWVSYSQCSQSGQTTGSTPNSHAMGSQTTTGLPKIVGNPLSSSEKGSYSPNLPYYQ